MSRTSTLFILAATALLSAPAHAINPPPQTGTGSGTATSGRSRCSTCRSSAEDRYREKLLLQIDSLRWHIENRRLTDEERRRTVSELNSAIRALQQSLDEATRGAAVAAAVEVAGASEPAVAPSVAVARIAMRARGYLGVTFDGPHTEIMRPGEHALRFYQYPRIALVEASSPAERAGVLQGDTVVSFNGADLTQNEINLTKLLIPQSKVVMRVRRDGNAKDLKVTIGEAPEYYARRREQSVGSGYTPGVIGAEPVRVLSVPPRSEPSQAPIILWQEYEGVAGARVETISEGLGKAIGVDEGVLVMRVRPGTPAARAGLRDGDVIVRASGKRIRTVPELRNILAGGDREEGVTLLIRRERKERDVTLRW